MLDDDLSLSLTRAQVIKFLLKKGGEVALLDLDKNGWMPLQCAASEGHFEVALCKRRRLRILSAYSSARLVCVRVSR